MPLFNHIFISIWHHLLLYEYYVLIRNLIPLIFNEGMLFMNNMNNRHNKCCCSQHEHNHSQNCGCNKMQASPMHHDNGCKTMHHSSECMKDRCCDADSSMHNDPIYGMPLGIGYVPWQQWGEIYNPCDALKAATIFPPLNLPFYGCIPRNCNRSGGAL